jgi:hypothetical protein
MHSLLSQQLAATRHEDVIRTAASRRAEAGEHAPRRFGLRFVRRAPQGATRRRVRSALRLAH